jgi:nucleoid-associated protein YgaU
MSACFTRAARALRCLGVLGLGGLCLAASGCSRGPAPPAKDPTKGEYYSAEEVARLSSAERDRYCSYMETSLHGLKGESASLRSRLDSLSVVSDTLRNQSIRISSQTREVNTATRDLRLKAKALNSYVVKSGENLRKISSELYGDPSHWKEIYDANKAAIGAEDAELKPGMRLTLPPKEKLAPSKPPAAPIPPPPPKGASSGE